MGTAHDAPPSRPDASSSRRHAASPLVAAIEPGVGGGAPAIERSWAVVLVVGFAVMALTAAFAPSVVRSTDRIDVA